MGTDQKKVVFRCVPNAFLVDPYNPNNKSFCSPLQTNHGLAESFIGFNQIATSHNNTVIRK